MNAPEPPAATVTPRDSRAALRWAAYGVGVLLLVAAVYVVVARGDSLGPALRCAAAAPWWMIALVLLLPLVNVALTAASFTLLTRRHGRVGYGEVLALILSSWLLNHLPMRPGLVGRVVYHKAVNRIPVLASVRVIGEQIVLGAIGLGLVLMLVLLTLERPIAWLFAGACILHALPVLVGLSMRAAPRTYALVIALRIADCAVWTLRYLLLFELIGQPIGTSGAAVIAVSSQAAMLSPVPLGLREWVVGLVAAAMAGGAAEVTVEAMTVGVAADLVNRAAELAVALPLGLVAGWVVLRRVRTAEPRDLPHTAGRTSV